VRGGESELARAVDALHVELLQAGEDAPRLRRILAERDPEDTVLIALLRRALPVRFLELVGTTPPWCERRTVVGKLVQNPRTPRTLSLRLLPTLFWRDLAETAASPVIPPPVRVRAEAHLKDLLRDLRLGERIALAKMATPSVLALLLSDPEPGVAVAALINPRLREEDLLLALRQPTVASALIEAAAASPKWKERYAVRLGLALQPRTPRPIALLQLSSLLKRDLRRVAATAGLPQLVRVAAERLAEEDKNPEGSAT
jgi:hypothetical protein